MIESNNSFGPFEFGYIAAGPGSYWFAKWFHREPPARGFKIHVSPQPQDAEIVARSVLPKLRQLRIPHKVVKTLNIYREQLNSDQRGKFITIYSSGAAEAQQVVNAISPELRSLGLSYGVIPTTRESRHRECEIGIGDTGLIFTRWYEEGDQD